MVDVLDILMDEGSPGYVNIGVKVPEAVTVTVTTHTCFDTAVQLFALATVQVCAVVVPPLSHPHAVEEVTVRHDVVTGGVPLGLHTCGPLLL